MERKIIDDYFALLKNALDGVSREELISIAGVIRDAGDRHSAIYICGNGGSAAMASHMACDLGKGASYGFARRYNAFALSDNSSTLLAYANDVSYDDIFIEQLKNALKPGDLVIGISGSGNSPNILRAVEYANAHGGITIGITGYPTGRLQKISMHNVSLNIDNMQIAEDLHLILNHNLVNLLVAGAKEKAAQPK
ncbi:MAG TPA: SIS domain-containing protein [Spirochaetia bacterium]|nr:SIS domain-containing protein [Spirochaetia bacterium]